MKNLYFIATDDYDMVVSVDDDKNCRYLTENNDFPLLGEDPEVNKKKAMDFLASVEDDSSWEDDCSYDQIFVDQINILAEISKEL